MPCSSRHLLACIFLAVALCAAYSTAATPAPAPSFTDCVFVVDIRGLSDERRLAASVAVGLLNRFFDKPTALALNSPTDWKWVAGIRGSSELTENSRWVAASDADIIAYAVAVGAAKSVVNYSPSEPWALASVVTLCGINSAIPVPSGGKVPANSSITPVQPHFLPELVNITGIPPRSVVGDLAKLDLKMGLDALGGNSTDPSTDPFLGTRAANVAVSTAGKWADELDATLWAWSHLLPDCLRTEEIIAIQRPEVLRQGFLADYVVSQQMFLFFLPAMCVPGPQQVLFRALTNQAYAAGKQLKVMGYSIEDEVVADCSSHHTEVSLVSDWCPNLSFYSKMETIRAVLQQVPLQPAPAYDPNSTYIAFINSDGDNMQMENNGNRDGMDARVQLCAQEGSACPPLGWTMSNQLATYAPYQLRWYYSQAQKTGNDTFLMGPSGYGFLHPALMPTDSPLLTEFVTNTVEAAQQLSMTSYVHWDVDDNGLSHGSSAWMGLGSVAVNSTGLPAGSAAADRPLPSVSDREQMAAGLLDKGSGRQVTTAVASRPLLAGAQNELARESYIRRYEGSQIDTIFAPGEYKIPRWVGNIAAIQELFRWGIEMPTEEAIHRVNDIPRGTVGYVYKIFNVEMKEYERLAKSIAKHVHIVDHRQLHDIALQQKFRGEGASH